MYDSSTPVFYLNIPTREVHFTVRGRIAVRLLLLHQATRVSRIDENFYQKDDHSILITYIITWGVLPKILLSKVIMTFDWTSLYFVIASLHENTSRLMTLNESTLFIFNKHMTSQ